MPGKGVETMDLREILRHLQRGQRSCAVAKALGRASAGKPNLCPGARVLALKRSGGEARLPDSPSRWSHVPPAETALLPIVAARFVARPDTAHRHPAAR